MSDKSFVPIDGLSLTDSENLLLAIMDMARPLQRQFEQERHEVQVAEQQLHAVMVKAISTRRKLEAVAVFLTNHQPRTGESWYAELGLTEGDGINDN
ncbi:MAG: hypothetical protein FOGNACKC_00827 [Anaerolineae bacterium]|nr:hypothetical protein [Anaerolineae bacterium]